MVHQTKQMCKEVFLSLSDETKIDMHNRQFQLNMDSWYEVYEWIDENFSNIYYLGKSNDDCWLMIYDEADAAAFKLKWL